MSAVSGMAYMTFATVSAAYRVWEAGLDPLGLILVGTALELSVLLAEAPTGAFADVYGRRLSVILGFAPVGIGLFPEGSTPLFASIPLSQVVWGTGCTFTSGAMQAWLADELGDEAETARTFVRAAKFESAGSLVGIALSVALASVYTGLALMAAGVTCLALAAFPALAMSERGFRARGRAAAGGACGARRGHARRAVRLQRADDSGVRRVRADRRLRNRNLRGVGGVRAALGDRPVHGGMGQPKLRIGASGDGVLAPRAGQLIRAGGVRSGDWGARAGARLANGAAGVGGAAPAVQALYLAARDDGGRAAPPTDANFA